MDKTGLIPARFITMIGHFVMLMMAMYCRDTNVRACAPYNYDNEDYIEKDRELVSLLCLFQPLNVCFKYFRVLPVHLLQDGRSKCTYACVCGFTLLIGIIAALAFLGIEMFGFLFGFSMFMPLIGTISVAGHFSACVSLSYWLIDTWDCLLFWWVFFFCSFIPGCIEISIITNILLIKRIVC